MSLYVAIMEIHPPLSSLVRALLRTVKVSLSGRLARMPDLLIAGGRALRRASRRQLAVASRRRRLDGGSRRDGGRGRGCSGLGEDEEGLVLEHLRGLLGLSPSAHSDVSKNIFSHACSGPYEGRPN
jgi:hypothetical protein